LYVEVDDVWCVRFDTTYFSPYAILITSEGVINDFGEDSTDTVERNYNE
jgi:hypothetical protein